MLERRFRRSRVRVNFVLIWHHLAQRRGTRGRSCRIATSWVSASYLTEIASISPNELVPLFVRRQNFLNALPDRSAFVLFHVDKIRLSREMATNIQSFGSED